MKIGVCIDHHQALAAYSAAGGPFPTIPAGKNTMWVHFVTEDGNPAVIVNQRGMTPEASDNEESINGCTLAVALEAGSHEEGRAALEAWVREILELK